MGFGLMLIGYLAAYVMSYAFVPKIIGYALMIWGTCKLMEYDLKFKRCLWPLLSAGVLSVYDLAEDICKSAGVESAIFSKGIVNAVNYADLLLSVCFIVFLMIAITSIANATELPKLSFRAMRNILILLLGEVLYVVALCLPAGQVANGIAYFALIVRALRIVLDLMLLFACLRMICQEGDQDMPERESNIPIIRKMEAVLSKRDKDAFDSGIKYSNVRRAKKERKKGGRKKR